MSADREIGTDLLIDLSDNLAQLVRKEFGISPDRAVTFGKTAAGWLADHWGGQIVYIPKDAAGRQRTMYLQMYEEFTGDNHAELARKYDISVQHVYRIVRLIRAERQQKQYPLF